MVPVNILRDCILYNITKVVIAKCGEQIFSNFMSWFQTFQRAAKGFAFGEINAAEFKISPSLKNDDKIVYY